MNHFGKSQLTVLWAYLVELLLSVCILVLIFRFNSPQELSEFFKKANAGWLTLEGVLLAGAIGVWVAHFQIVGTEFGKYLRWAKHETVFMGAFNVGLGSHFFAFLLLIFCGVYSNSILIYLTVLILLYALINTLTLFKNAMLFLKLKSAFDFEYGAIKNVERGQTILSRDTRKPVETLDVAPVAHLPIVDLLKRDKTKTKKKRKTK